MAAQTFDRSGGQQVHAVAGMDLTLRAGEVIGGQPAKPRQLGDPSVSVLLDAITQLAGRAEGGAVTRLRARIRSPQTPATKAMAPVSHRGASPVSPTPDKASG
jgi:hypothetical protein